MIHQHQKNKIVKSKEDKKKSSHEDSETRMISRKILSQYLHTAEIFQTVVRIRLPTKVLQNVETPNVQYTQPNKVPKNDNLV